MKGKDVVIVTAWQRPEMLWLCLDRLTNARLAEEHEIIVRIDRDGDPEVRSVAEHFSLRSGFGVGPLVWFVPVENHGYEGNHYNTLEGYRQAVGDRPEASLVYLVEEDILVADDFFEFHRAAHELAKPFCVTACRSHWTPPLLSTDRSGVYLSSRYQSLGVSFRPEAVREFLVHATPDYYRDRKKYIVRTFKSASLMSGLPIHGDQDNLIDHVMDSQRHKIAVPLVPRAYHAGWYGMNRKTWSPRGTLEERIAQVRSTLQHPSRLAEVAGKYLSSVTPVDLRATTAVPLKLVPLRNTSI